MLAKLYVGTLAALIWIAALVGKHFWPDLDIGAIVTTCAGVLSGLGVYHVAGPSNAAVPDAPAAPVADKGQGGFAAVPFVALLAVIALAMLAGCTTTTASMYSGIYTQAKAGVQVFDDNALVTMKDLVCAQPYSAIQRHPELQPGILALCGPMTNTATLDPAQVMQMLSIAKQLGLAPAAPAAAAPAAK